jgi:hypothetical protein
MGTFSFSVALEIPSFALSKDAFPVLASAVDHVTESIKEEWQGYARGQPLPSGQVINSRTGAYLRSIMSRSIGDFSGEVYSELPYAQAIEEGSPAWDMKKILDSSYKVRTTKNGKRYLIIPFRWGVPDTLQGNTMPTVVHNWWKGPDRKRSSVAGTYQRQSGAEAYDIKTRQRVMVPGWRYNWGDRLRKADLAAMGVTGKPSQHMAGMVNFRTPGAKGGASNSQYLTFRVMMEGSKGWIAKARPGLFPAKTAGENHQAVAEQIFKAAVEQDINGILGDTSAVPE